MHATNVAFCICLILALQQTVDGAKRGQLTDYARTGNTLVRIPFFGAGVTQLLRYLRPMEQPEAQSRRSPLRTALDENYVSYRGAQLWKLNFNGTRRPDAETPDAIFSQFLKEFGESNWPDERQLSQVDN